MHPNNLAVDRLLKRTAEVLRQHGRNPALDGYAGGAKRAWELASALGEPRLVCSWTMPCRVPVSSSLARRRAAPASNGTQARAPTATSSQPGTS